MLSANHWYSLGESESLLSNSTIGDITWVGNQQEQLYMILLFFSDFFPKQFQIMKLLPMDIWLLYKSTIYSNAIPNSITLHR